MCTDAWNYVNDAGRSERRIRAWTGSEELANEKTKK